MTDARTRIIRDDGRALAATSQSAYEREMEKRLRIVTERLDAMTALLGDAMAALKPFAQIHRDRSEKYRKRGGQPESFPGTHPAYDIEASQICVGKWRAANALVARIEAALKPEEPKS